MKAKDKAELLLFEIELYYINYEAAQNYVEDYINKRYEELTKKVEKWIESHR